MEDRFVQIAAILTIQAKDQNTASQIRASLSGDIDLLVWGASMNSSMVKVDKTALKSCSISLDFYAIGGDGIKRLTKYVDLFAGKQVNDVDTIFAAARDGIKTYLEDLAPDTAPAVRYYCMPLAALRRSEAPVREIQEFLPKRQRAAEGIIELVQLAHNGLGLNNGQVAKEIDDAVRERAKAMLMFLRATFALGHGTFPDVPKAQAAAQKLDTHFTAFRAKTLMIQKVTAKPPTWTKSLYDDWNDWMEGYPGFHFVEDARTPVTAAVPSGS
jgi:hypothetical protein